MSDKKRSGSKPPPQDKHNDPDRGLWDRVKRTVDPLDAKQRGLYSQALADFLDAPTSNARPSQAMQPAHPVQGALGRHIKGHAASTKPSAVSSPQSVQPHGAQPLVDLDRKTKSRIARGRTPIDARLDLHGLRQHEAHDVLRSFIWRCHANGHRTVLVITGKGSRQRNPHPEAPPWAVGSGILRKAVPGWLAAPDMRGAVLGVDPAHVSHGGEGALYVRLRAKKARR